jgi:hypothetical protein
MFILLLIYFGMTPPALDKTYLQIKRDIIETIETHSMFDDFQDIVLYGASIGHAERMRILIDYIKKEVPEAADLKTGIFKSIVNEQSAKAYGKALYKVRQEYLEQYFSPVPKKYTKPLSQQLRWLHEPAILEQMTEYLSFLDWIYDRAPAAVSQYQYGQQADQGLTVKPYRAANNYPAAYVETNSAFWTMARLRVTGKDKRKLSEKYIRKIVKAFCGCYLFRMLNRGKKPGQLIVGYYRAYTGAGGGKYIKRPLARADRQTKLRLKNFNKIVKYGPS